MEAEVSVQTVKLEAAKLERRINKELKGTKRKEALKVYAELVSFIVDFEEG